MENRSRAAQEAPVGLVLVAVSVVGVAGHQCISGHREIFKYIKIKTNGNLYDEDQTYTISWKRWSTFLKVASYFRAALSVTGTTGTPQTVAQFECSCGRCMFTLPYSVGYIPIYTHMWTAYTVYSLWSNCIHRHSVGCSYQYDTFSSIESVIERLAESNKKRSIKIECILLHKGKQPDTANCLQCNVQGEWQKCRK